MAIKEGCPLPKPLPKPALEQGTHDAWKFRHLPKGVHKSCLKLPFPRLNYFFPTFVQQVPFLPSVTTSFSRSTKTSLSPDLSCTYHVNKEDASLVWSHLNSGGPLSIRLWLHSFPYPVLAELLLQGSLSWLVKDMQHNLGKLGCLKIQALVI